MVKCIIIDDERSARESLQELLKRYCPDVEVISTARSGSEGILEIELHQPDAVFLDIHMSDMDGFTMLSKLSVAQPMVVFVTAYEKYALRAIKASAIDYLLKPLSIKDLQQATNKIAQLQKLKGENPSFNEAYNDALKLMIQNNSSDYPKRLALPHHLGYRFENMEDITHLDSDSNYTTIYLKNGEKLVASKPMKHFEDILDSEMFVRIHNSHIINIRFLKTYSREDGGVAELFNGTVVQISKRRLPLFLDTIKNKFIKP